MPDNVKQTLKNSSLANKTKTDKDINEKIVQLQRRAELVRLYKQDSVNDKSLTEEFFEGLNIV